MGVEENREANCHRGFGRIKGMDARAERTLISRPSYLLIPAKNYIFATINGGAQPLAEIIPFEPETGNAGAGR
ncbi:MAG: hypothetical protein JG782_1627 [Anaerophaga sp.]|nr:hypothetical protein [Anaerophaga sp.]